MRHLLESRFLETDLIIAHGGLWDKIVAVGVGCNLPFKGRAGSLNCDRSFRYTGAGGIFDRSEQRTGIHGLTKQGSRRGKNTQSEKCMESKHGWKNLQLRPKLS